MTDPDLQQTPLHDLHVELGARMVPFAGYAMPVQYTGILQEHAHTRASAGLFDVSHMGQIALRGDDAAAALETLVPADIRGLGELRQRYALFTNNQGGILDDLMVVNAGDHLQLVVNAACKHDDLAHLQTGIGDRVEIEPRFERGLLALQGPAAETVLARFDPRCAEMSFMQAARLEIVGADCFVTRSGYTGEDGYELGMAAQDAETVARALLGEAEVEAIGLGARDSLRLEAGLCLSGHDFDTTTTPVEAGLVWSIAKPRRAAGGYPGDKKIVYQIAYGAERNRVGIKPGGRAPAREGATILDMQGEPIGTVTSGGFGPSLGAPVAMGYVASAFRAVGTEVQLDIRGKAQPAVVAELPFVKKSYRR